MKNCVICQNEGQRHHIIYKSQGGYDFPLNFIYLCSYHHMGEMGPHKNREFDMELKLQLQNNLKNILTKDYYTKDDLIKLLGLNTRQAKILVSKMKKYTEGYKTNVVIKLLLGNRYYDNNK